MEMLYVDLTKAPLLKTILTGTVLN